MKKPTASDKLRIAVTGASGDLGSLLLPLLEQDDRVQKIFAIDLAKPATLPAKAEYRHIDLAQPGSDARLAELLIQSKVDVVCHLAFAYGRVHSPAYAHELEVVGSMHVLAGVARARVRRLVVPSLTMLYGADPKHPAAITEGVALKGCPESRFIHDKVEIERQLEQFRASHPATQVAVLRFAPIVGPSVNNPITRWLRTRLVPTLLGFDPLWQLVHEQDAATALHCALFARAQGAFNIAGNGVMSLSGLVRASGGSTLPLPAPFVRATSRLLEWVGIASVPSALMDYLHYSWTVDSGKAETELGFVPRFRSKEAAASLRGS